jgi:signal transduction histidine kinase
LRYRRPGVHTGPLRARDPERARRLCELTRAHLCAGTLDAAVDVAMRAIVLDPDSHYLRLVLSQALYRTGSFESALLWLEPFSGTDHADCDFLRGLILSDQNRIAEALEAFRLALSADPRREAAHLHRAALQLNDGDPQAAVAELQDLLHHNPKNPKAQTIRATAFMELGEPDKALSDLAGIPEELRSAEHTLLLARAYLLSGRPDSEIESAFQDGMRRHPQDDRLRLAFARYLASRRVTDPLAAERSTKEALRLTEGDRSSAVAPHIQAKSLFLLGELATEEPDGQDRAESCYHQGLLLRPDDPEGLTGMGALLLNQGRPAHALPWLLRSLLVDPERPRTVEYLARALCAVPDDEAVARWLGLVTAGLPQQSPTLLAQLVRFMQEAGRADAYAEVHREAHRMKNLIAVLASRVGSKSDPQLHKQLQDLYGNWAAFLDRIRQPSPAPVLLSPGILVRRAIEVAVGDPRRIHFVVPPGLPLIKGDIESLVDALANIIRNAYQAGPKDNMVRVLVRWREDDRWVKIAVTDEGKGIDLQDRRRIFDPGFSKRDGGSGLGLSIARRVVMAHGGRISVASAPGGPTTFTVRLPVATQSVSYLEFGTFQSLTFPRHAKDA